MFGQTGQGLPEMLPVLYATPSLRTHRLRGCY